MIWIIWFVFYFLTGAIALASSRTSFLASTVDHVEQGWVALIFLNIPLQLVLAATSVAFAAASNRQLTTVSDWLAGLTTFLMFSHLVLSVLSR